MNTIDVIDSWKKPKKRINKSLGNRLVEDKIRFNKLQEIKSKTFNDAINKLNKTLKKSESLLHINHYPKKMTLIPFCQKMKLIILKN